MKNDFVSTSVFSLIPFTPMTYSLFGKNLSDDESNLDEAKPFEENKTRKVPILLFLVA